MMKSQIEIIICGDEWDEKREYMERCLRLTEAQIKELSEIINSNKSTFNEGKKAQAILMINRGTELKEIKMFTGYSRRHAFTLRKSYLAFGLEIVKDKAKKPRALLTQKERASILDIIKSTKPADYGYELNYWTTNILAYHIKKNYDVQYKSKTSVRIFFKEAKFSYHKPDKTYQRRNEDEVEKWKLDIKPIIEKAMSDPNTVILTEDEMVLSTQTTTQKIWLPVGEYPKIEVATKRKNRSIYGFLDIKTGREYAFKTEWQNMFITEKILKKIRKRFPGKKILIIWDQAGWHRGSVVQDYLKKSNGKISTIYFPAGAPELNPQEHVWKAGRAKTTHNNFIADIDTATDQFVIFLNQTKFEYSLLGFSAKPK